MTKIFVIRMFLLPVGAVANFGIASILISKLGIDDYAYFAFISTIPMLLPFLDLGFGMSVFNSYAVKEFKARNMTLASVAFYSLSLFLMIFVLLIGITLLWMPPDLFFNNFDSKHARLLSFIMILLASISSPFLMSAKKMQAEHKHLMVILTQSVTPPASFLIVYILLFEFDASIDLIILVPATVNFSSTIVLFIASKIYMDLNAPNFLEVSKYLPGIMKLGFWVTILNSVYALLWQIPRLKYQASGNIVNVAEISLILLLVVPSFSLVGSSALWLAPLVRKESVEDQKIILIKSTLRKVLALVGCLNIGILAGSIFFGFFDIAYPSFSALMFVILNNFLIPFWVVPITRFTDAIDIRWYVQRSIPIVLLFSLLLFRLDSQELIWSFFLYALPIQVFMITFSWVRLKSLKDVS